MFLHIPDDLSATKFELPVEGVAELLQKEEEYYLAWNPTDITHNDVACLYASETDAWTMVDNGMLILKECMSTILEHTNMSRTSHI